MKYRWHSELELCLLFSEEKDFYLDKAVEALLRPGAVAHMQLQQRAFLYLRHSEVQRQIGRIKAALHLRTAIHVHRFKA